MKRIHRSLLISLILTSLESRTGMVSAISSFVDFLNSDASASLSSEDVPSYLFMTSDFVEHWNHRKNPQQTLHDYWVHEMPRYRFFLPSILDYWVWKSDGDLPADSLSVTIPVQIKNFQPTVWISGTHHNIFQVANALADLGYKILNVIVWQKTNPPPNLSCRYFTFSTEFIIWARREPKTPHFYNYELMHELAGGQQMRDVWPLPAIGSWEKSFGKHPTQKPLSLLVRILLASTCSGQWVLDPFAGSCTTGIAAHLLGRKFFGIDQSQKFLELGIQRFYEAQTPAFRAEAFRRIADLQNLPPYVQEPPPDWYDFPSFMGIA